MRLSHKLKKLFNFDAVHSTKAMLRRLTYPLPARPFIEAIDKEGFEKIRARHAKPGEKVNPKKYLDLDEWMRTNVKRVRDHRIRQAPPQWSILDIGSGSGYFLHILKCLGHEVTGMDIDTEPVFRETFALLKIPRIIHRIEPFQPLPDLGGKFDLVTAHMTCFNRRADDTHWGREEWDYFLRDLLRHLKPGGRMQFDLNPLRDGRHMEPDLKKYFKSLGGKVDRRKVYLMTPFKT
ncbi:MAG TPA: class I SAM-dependent methyltransferase [Verrucomicrobiaceae bacterium]